MSEITVKIDAYAAGKIDFPTLRDYLVNLEYVAPVRYDTPPGATEQVEWDHTHTDGSFDEVLDAVPGKISDVEYLEIVAGINALRRPAVTT